MNALATIGLFFVTAILEILGCYLSYLWIKKDGSIWLLLPAVVSLMAFSWFLTFHPFAAGKVYAAYGGVYVATALIWMLVIEKVVPDKWDLVGASIAILGMMIIFFMPRD
ncbi:MAG: YnfA family protein [Nitrosomonas sp.]